MPNSSDQVEDIFESTVTASVEPVLTEPAIAPAPTVRRNPILVIAMCLVALLLLSGIGLGVWFWLQRPAEPPTNTNMPVIVNDTVVTVPDTTNTTPTNANTTPPANVNTTPAFVDVDHDGLSDAEELVENTNPKKKDTDEDGLSDREEVRVYDTDPRNPDTDGDGYTDGNEVTHFYHPNSPDPKKRLFDLPQ